jgi:hypothetical protein
MALKDPQGNFIGSPLLGETTYEYDWFSGSQINVMVGDVVIDSCIGIGFNESQSKTPVFGYANQYYAFVADGKVVVQGSLTIAFKEAGYLFLPIRRFLHRKANSEASSPRYGADKSGLLTQGVTPAPVSLTAAADAAINKRAMRANVEQMTDWQHGPMRVGSKYNRFWQELGSLDDDRFEDWAETFEDALWYGSDPTNPQLRDRLFSNNLDLADFIEDDTETDELVYSHRRASQYPPIDVWITYGDMDRQAVNHTVRKIMDLSFIGQAQQIEISGEPTYEVYHFLARNLV